MKFTPLMDMIDADRNVRATDYIGLLRRLLKHEVISTDELDTVMEGLQSRHAQALMVRVQPVADRENYPNCTEVGASLSPPIGRSYAQAITQRISGDVYVRLCYLAEVHCGEVNIEWTKLERDFLNMMSHPYISSTLLERVKLEGEELPHRILLRRVRRSSPQEILGGMTDEELRKKFALYKVGVERLRQQLMSDRFPLWVTQILPPHLWAAEEEDAA